MSVRIVVLKEASFFFQSIFHCEIVVYIFLGSSFYSNVAQSQRDFLVENHFSCVSSFVHYVYFCYHSNSSYSLGIELLGKLQRLLSTHVSVRWNHTENYCSLVFAVSSDHFLCDSLYVFRLVSYGDSRNSREIDQSQVHYVSVENL